MADLPPEWLWVRDLPEGGQAHTFVVKRASGTDSTLYVLKRLKNPERADYFEREIQACTTLDHPNILKLAQHGQTPKGKLFLIAEYCEGGSLAEGKPNFDTPGDGLRFFQQIVAGVAHAHSHQPPICHLDLKPENILLRHGRPVVGDFGICFIKDDQVTLTKEGPRGSMYYCAPELRNPKISGVARPMAADVYSLGKILYWLFTGDVYDGHEEDYANEASRHLAHLLPMHAQFAFIDELVAETVRRNVTGRPSGAPELLDRVKRTVERIDAAGHVLDLRVPQRCLYCAVGTYQLAHERFGDRGYGPLFPDIELRRNPPYNAVQPVQPDIYENLKNAAYAILGSKGRGGPLFLVCDYCGNVQYFRFDLTKDGHGENWRP